MKATLYTSKGEKKSDIQLPSIFDASLREDLVAKYVEAEKIELRQPYGSYKEAGKRHSASGTISHRRHEWKGHYGKGIARLPRKVMWRRGVNFYWVGAEVSNTRGGRKAHPPKGIWRPRKINKKEQQQAFSIALSATANPKYILNRYTSITDIKSVPAVLESLPSKAREFHSLLNSIYGSVAEKVLKHRTVRPGRGKLRGRKYKTSAGILLVTSQDESAKFSGVEVKSVKDLNIADFYPLGRLTLYTQKSLKELEEKHSA